ncbi:MAG TPA: RimK-like ATPgrasp N-terminal domain-containing protein, partial [Pirellulaceae bacterium]
MRTLIITDKQDDWPTSSGAAEVIEAWTYLTDATFSRLRNARVFNLCGSYRYQTTGYYVSLLAEARGHRPLPNVLTMQDLQLRHQSIMRMIPPDLEELIQQSLAPIHSPEFTLSVYFGHNLAARYDRLSRQLFSLFQCPLLRFSFSKRDRWQLRSARALDSAELSPQHRAFAAEAAQLFFTRGSNGGRPKRKRPRFDIAILHDPANTEHSPSDPKALEKFARAADG